METSTIHKNDIRFALIHLYCGIFKLLPDHKQTKLRELKQILNRLSIDIKIKFQNSNKKNDIRKILKEELINIISMANEISVEKKFKNSQLLYDIFDGVPISPEVQAHRMYDLVVKRDSSRTVAWVFAPSAKDGFDPLQAQIQAEQDYKVPCIDIKIHHEIPNSPEEMINESEIIPNQKIQEEQTEQPKLKNKVLGKILFSRKEQFVLRAEQDRDEIKGYLFEEYASTVKPLDILVLESQEIEKKIYATVIKIEMNPLSGSGYVRQFSEFATHVLFKPLMEVTPEYIGRVRPFDPTGYVIRRPTDVELNDVLNIPKDGIPIARLDYDGTHDAFRYPLIPKDTIYQSLIVAGVQGKGKSNFVKLLIRSFVSNSNVITSERPAVIILDGEGEYKQFTAKSEMTSNAKQFLDKYGIGDVKVNVYKIDDDPSQSDSTLTLRGIDRHDIIDLMPELESKTENILQVLINHVGNQIDNDKGPQDIETLKNRLLAEINNSQLIHISQRPAIARAILSPSLNLLDQVGKTALTPHLLFKPGTVTVIDYQGLDFNKRRVVALYLLHLLDKFKMKAPNYEPGVLLFVDESEALFPESPSKASRDYVQRISAHMEDITNRGRKRKYGVCLVTHLPTEVNKKVGDLANTKIAFGCSGAEKWIRNYFGREYVSEISSLPTGVCRITIKINTNDQGPINARLNVPFVGDKRAVLVSAKENGGA